MELNDHQKKCHSFFKDIEKGGEIFVHFDSFPSQEDGFRLLENYDGEYGRTDLKLTIVTEDMLEYDVETLEGDRIAQV
ncbi:MAG: hypothetical protein LUC95_09440 [Lachnospiraceae bacterium]|nr:hypothetical protein [Lachnospiraceae bacterium]